VIATLRRDVLSVKSTLPALRQLRHLAPRSARTNAAAPEIAATLAWERVVWLAVACDAGVRQQIATPMRAEVERQAVFKNMNPPFGDCAESSKTTWIFKPR
jgi:hypothetical protein